MSAASVAWSARALATRTNATTAPPRASWTRETKGVSAMSDPNGDGVKRCNKCSTQKPLSDFNRNRSKLDGLQTYCRQCQRAADAARIARDPDGERQRKRDCDARNRDKVRERKREWRDANSGLLQAISAEYRAANPHKVAAKNAVRRALRSGVLVRKPCEACGDANSHAHHHVSYHESHHLNVMWLCPLHHRRWHAEHGEVGTEAA